ncbi:MAG TPA: histidine--tRNA ligase [Acidimicrobiales bacterium]|nr:histidine--tRNA ligase [Acidimicrobiales bacterium]
MADDQGPLRAPKGTKDVLWPESARWEALVARFAAFAGRSGFGLVINPMFEETRLFRRSIGETTDIVGKEMYEFEDKDGRAMALRPEGTASIVRAFVQHRPSVPWKAWYATPAFRYEQPQAGRLRQHHQLGVEALGTEDPDIDVEVIALAADVLADLGLESVDLAINSMGCGVCRPAHVESLRAYLGDHRDELCDEHRERFDRNPLRVLDCKRPPCRAVSDAAPRLVDVLDEACAAHFSRVREGLDALGHPQRLEPRLVRGMDYYTRTTFEFMAERLGTAQNTVCGGGRYDGLVEEIGGPPTPGIGFGMGIERLLLACDAEGVFGLEAPVPAVFVVDLTDGRSARQLAAALRAVGLSAERAYDGRSLKAQLKAADRSGASYAVIVGAEELAAGVATVRPLRHDGEQHRVPRGEVVGHMRALIGHTDESGQR